MRMAEWFHAGGAEWFHARRESERPMRTEGMAMVECGEQEAHRASVRSYV